MSNNKNLNNASPIGPIPPETGPTETIPTKAKKNKTENYQNSIWCFNNLKNVSDDDIKKGIDLFFRANEKKNTGTANFFSIVRETETGSVRCFVIFKKCVSVRLNSSKAKFTLNIAGEPKIPYNVLHGTQIEIFKQLLDGLDSKKYLHSSRYEGFGFEHESLLKNDILQKTGIPLDTERLINYFFAFRNSHEDMLKILEFTKNVWPTFYSQCYTYFCEKTFSQDKIKGLGYQRLFEYFEESDFKKPSFLKNDHKTITCEDICGFLTVKNPPNDKITNDFSPSEILIDPKNTTLGEKITMHPSDGYFLMNNGMEVKDFILTGTQIFRRPSLKIAQNISHYWRNIFKGREIRVLPKSESDILPNGEQFVECKQANPFLSTKHESHNRIKKVKEIFPEILIPPFYTPQN